MPNAKVLESKKAIVSELAERLKKAQCGIFVNYKGISVADDTELRSHMRENNVDYTVVKNTLTKRALEEAGIQGFDETLNGATALATTEDDPIVPLRLLSDTADKLKSEFAIKGAFMDGKILSAEEIESLSKLSSAKDVQAQLVGTILAPVVNFILTLEAIVAKNPTDSKPAEAAETAE